MRLVPLIALTLMLSGGIASADRDRDDKRDNRRNDRQAPRAHERQRPQQHQAPREREHRDSRPAQHQAPRDRNWDNNRDRRPAQHQGPRERDHRPEPVRRDHDRRDHDRRTYDNRRDDHRTVVRDHGRRWERPQYRNNRYYRPRYQGPVRANRRVIERRPIYVTGDRFTFHSGRTVVYRRPVFRERYYNINVRPQIVVEDFEDEPGYIWVQGSWNWNNGEWIWTGGHYEADPSIRVFYDDDSYDINE
jgi:hypothetical protein